MFVTPIAAVTAGLALASVTPRMPIPFENVKPQRAIYVSVGKGPGNGSQSKPYHSIQEAVSAARPGTIINVLPGTYTETIKVPKGASGTESAPIWLASQGGKGAAKIIGEVAAKPVIQALGVKNYIVRDFALSGGYDGIQFSQSGRDFSSLVKNVVIQGNSITDISHDGIKIGQASNVYVGYNKIDRVRDEEGIDFVAVDNAIIEHNEISNDGSSAAGIFTKGGATHIWIERNYVHDVKGDGISAGGWTDATSFKPGFRGYEARDVTVSGNRIENVGKRPVSIRGASYVFVTNNFLKASQRYGVAVYVSTGNPKVSVVARSSKVRIVNNILSGVSKVLAIDAGNDDDVSERGNIAGDWRRIIATDAPATDEGRSTSPALASQ